MTRMGNWFQTYTGKQFYPLDPRPEDINIVDIAHALTNICRYGGHAKHHYSVAQHSVYVSWLVEKREPKHAFWALMHDAAEAYVGDMVRPLKETMEMEVYRRAEAGVMIAVCKRFGMDPTEPEIVKEIDKRICVSEAQKLCHHPEMVWKWSKEAGIQPLDYEEWPVEHARTHHHFPHLKNASDVKMLFLERFAQLAYPYGAP